MRTNLELWLIVEQNFDELFYGGLCSLLFYLIGKDIINKSEYDILKKIINEYKDKLCIIKTPKKGGIGLNESLEGMCVLAKALYQEKEIEEFKEKFCF